MLGKIQALLAKVTKAEIRAEQSVGDVANVSAVEQKIKAIMANIFKIHMHAINENTSAENIDQWTSLGHVNLLVRLQNEFEIEFTDSQIVDMLSYKTVVQYVTAALKGNDNSR